MIRRADGLVNGNFSLELSSPKFLTAHLMMIKTLVKYSFTSEMRVLNINAAKLSAFYITRSAQTFVNEIPRVKSFQENPSQAL